MVARLSGPDATVLRALAEKVKAVMWDHGNTRSVRTDWGDPVKVLSIRMAEERARGLGVTRAEVAQALDMNFSGAAAGLYRQGEDLLPIMLRQLTGPVERVGMPEGYTLEWGGEHEEQVEANTKLMANVPIAFTAMFLIAVMLFNSLRHPLVIFLGLPLANIGVVAGMLLADKPFGFMAMLGFLSLSGMLIKNEIVVLDQINIEKRAGKKDFAAVIDASASRVRPVSMAAFTTVLGMTPLLWDAFFAPMAVTIMGGLTFATFLTLVVVPVLNSAVFGVHRIERTGKPVRFRLPFRSKFGNGSPGGGRRNIS